MREKKVSRFKKKTKKSLVILPLNEKQKEKQRYLLRFMSLFSPIFEVIQKDHNLSPPASILPFSPLVLISFWCILKRRGIKRKG